MATASDRPFGWLVRRLCEVTLVLVVFLAGFLVRDRWRPASPATRQDGPADPVASPAAFSEVNVEQRLVPLRLHLAGRVDLDPQHVATVSAGLAGSVDRLYLTSPGLFVSKGEILMQVLCPESLPVQAALLDARRARQEAGATSGFFARSQESQVAEARAALERAGFTAAQIADVERAGVARPGLAVRAPITGRLLRLDVHPGQFVARGDALCTLADLSVVRVVLTASQGDRVWLRYGQPVAFTPEGREDLAWGGWVASLSPVAEAPGGGWEVFVRALNEQDLLRPGMRVQAEVRGLCAGPGRVVDPNRARAWFCPVDPDVMAAESGTCPRCGRELVSGASLGYLTEPPAAEQPLVVPAAALVNEPDGPVLRVRRPDGGVERRAVALRARVGAEALVEGEIVPGETVLIPRIRPADAGQNRSIDRLQP